MSQEKSTFSFSPSLVILVVEKALHCTTALTTNPPPSFYSLSFLLNSLLSLFLSLLPSFSLLTLFSAFFSVSHTPAPAPPPMLTL